MPGGKIGTDFDAFLATVSARWPFLGEARARRMARAYGSMLDAMLEGVDNAEALGPDFGGGLPQVEVDWLINHEWAKSADDILVRRTKIGLATGQETRDILEAYLASKTGPPIQT